jgi:hypothetical protein
VEAVCGQVGGEEHGELPDTVFVWHAHGDLFWRVRREERGGRRGGGGGRREEGEGGRREGGRRREEGGE